MPFFSGVLTLPGMTPPPVRVSPLGAQSAILLDDAEESQAFSKELLLLSLSRGTLNLLAIKLCGILPCVTFLSI